MNSLFESRPELDGSAAPPGPLASWYTPGHTDGFGDRLLMSDNTGGSSLELLRFRPRFSASSGFERALRARVERQQFFRHPMFPPVRAVDRLDGDQGLALVSTHVPGRRLSELPQASDGRGWHPTLTAWLVRQAVPALAELQRRGGGPHGVLTADRIVLTIEGSLVIVDHVLGSALAQLYLPPARLWSDFRLIAPGVTGVASFDNRGDIVQLALIVLTLSLGRPITPDEYPSSIERLLEEFSDAVGRRSPKTAGALRLWLERALRPYGNLFKSAEHASEGLSDLPQLDPAPHTVLQLSARVSDAEVGVEIPEVDHVIAETETEARPEAAAVDAIDVNPAPAMRSWLPEPDSLSADVESPPNRAGAHRGLAAVCVLLSVIVVAEAVALVRLGRRPAVASQSPGVSLVIDSPQAGDAVVVDGRRAGVTPLEMKIGSGVRSIRVLSQPVPSVESASSGAAGIRAAGSTDAAAGARTRAGRLRIISPVELKIFEGEHALGSSADTALTLAVGEHQLVFMNSALRYRSRQSVTVKAGEIVSLQVTPPDGHLDINASPSAQVWVDGRALGETPLANIRVPAGEHDVTFRHPQLGERHVTVLVRSGDSGLVSATFSQ